MYFDFHFQMMNLLLLAIIIPVATGLDNLSDRFRTCQQQCSHAALKKNVSQCRQCFEDFPIGYLTCEYVCSTQPQEGNNLVLRMICGKCLTRRRIMGNMCREYCGKSVAKKLTNARFCSNCEYIQEWGRTLVLNY